MTTTIAGSTDTGDIAPSAPQAPSAVRPAGSFPGLTAGDLRITARGPRDNARLAGLLAEAVAG